MARKGRELVAHLKSQPTVLASQDRFPLKEFAPSSSYSSSGYRVQMHKWSPKNVQVQRLDERTGKVSQAHWRDVEKSRVVVNFEMPPSSAAPTARGQPPRSSSNPSAS